MILGFEPLALRMGTDYCWTQIPKKTDVASMILCCFVCLFDSEEWWSGWNALRGALEAGGP